MQTELDRMPVAAPIAERTLDWPLPEAPPKDKTGFLYAYLPALDGLRAISILWVLSVHWPMHLALRQTELVKRGALGVEIFFAISGFLVTRSLHQCVVRAEREGSGKRGVFRDFVIRRVARIWPPFFLALALALAAIFVDPALRANLAVLKPILWSFPTFLSNYTIPTHGSPLSLYITWSLCFEEQFYIILIVMYLLGATRLVSWIVGAALVSIATRTLVSVVYPERISEAIMQMETHYRFDAIAWGCLTWIYHRRLGELWAKLRYPRLVEVVVLGLCVFVCCFNPMNMALRAVWYVALAPIFAALVCVLCFSPNFWLARLLSWSPFVLVGSISYEIYLSHITVFRVLSRLGFERWLVVYYPATFLAAIAAGWVFHRVFSKPSQRIVRGWLERARA